MWKGIELVRVGMGERESEKGGRERGGGGEGGEVGGLGGGGGREGVRDGGGGGERSVEESSIAESYGHHRSEEDWD